MKHVDWEVGDTDNVMDIPHSLYFVLNMFLIIVFKTVFSTLCQMFDLIGYFPIGTLEACIALFAVFLYPTVGSVF
jgi:hypothetical protein